ncbi:hypothetical protein FRB90_010864, partial [Tulasnella sp. 427]
MALAHLSLRDTPTRQIESALEEQIRTKTGRLAVGTAYLHICFAAGSLQDLIVFLNPRRIKLSPSPEQAQVEAHSRLRSISGKIWDDHDCNFGEQPPAYISTIMAASLLLESLRPNHLAASDGRFLDRVDSIVLSQSNRWSHLALLAMICNTRS